MDTDEPSHASVAVFKKRGAKGKANLRKRPPPPPTTGNDGSDDNSSSRDDDSSSGEDEPGRRLKRRKKHSSLVTPSSNGASKVGANLGATVFTADRSVPITSVNDATKQSNWYDEGENESKSRSQPPLSGQDGMYKGIANQTRFIQKNPDAPNRTVGPVKAPTNIRTISIMDFAPDVCKDYKKTGFCGFGDNCKFAHTREVVSQGWQLDLDWDKSTAGKKVIGGTVVASADRQAPGEGNDEMDESEVALLKSIPFACILCKESYREPVVTRCGHYFCEPCALQRYRKDPSCAACGATTNGVFNVAKRLSKLLDRKKERMDRRKQAALEAGEDVQEEEEKHEVGSAKPVHDPLGKIRKKALGANYNIT